MLEQLQKMGVLIMEQSPVHGVNQQETDSADLEWLAGIIDSEGSIWASYSESHQSTEFSVEAANCNFNLIDESERVIGSLGIPYNVRLRQSKNVKWKDQKEISISNPSNVSKFLEIILPYLAGKRQIANLVLDLAKMKLDRRWKHGRLPDEIKLEQKIRQLNRRGTTAPQRLLTVQGISSSLVIKSELNGDIESVTEMITPSLHWLGGFIDGDGCIGLNASQKNSWSPSIQIANTNKAQMQAVENILTSHEAPFYKMTRGYSGKDSWKEIFIIMVCGYKRCNRVLPLVLPYVRVKKEQAKNMSWLIQSRLSRGPRSLYTKYETDICHLMNRLNQRGSNKLA